ncbi:MAG: RDD family protein [Deltaproteobacteria bacterium]|nr:RDD family protein [Deltaproteobacteria bacterium]
MTDPIYGGFWRRAAAYMTDKLIITILALSVTAAGLILIHLSAFSLTPAVFASPVLISFSGTSIVLDMLYFTYFHGTTGQTPGKKLFGLRVVPLSGEPVTLGLGFLRWVGYLLSEVIFYLGFFWIALDARKQGWHDKLAATVVVRTRLGTPVRTGPPPRDIYPQRLPPVMEEPETAGSGDREEP